MNITGSKNAVICRKQFLAFARPGASYVASTCTFDEVVFRYALYFFGDFDCIHDISVVFVTGGGYGDLECH